MQTILDCGHPPAARIDNWDGSWVGTGYGRDSITGETRCYQCCANLERARMIETGKATLYLTGETYTYEVTDWPGLLRFEARYVRSGRHNIAGTRLDFEFTGPDGFRWVGVQYGEGTQIAHCKRTKEKVI